MDLKVLQKYYNACNPDEALDPNDPRNVDIDSMGDPDERVRGDNWVSRLARQVELSGDRPVCKYFTGLPGSGKSTELRRLAARLRRKDRAHLLPVIIDADETLDLTAEIDVPDIMTALIYGTERQILIAEKKDPDDALKDGYGKRFWSWLTRTDINLNSVEAGLEGAVVNGKVVAEMKTRPTLRQRIRATIAAHLTSFLKEIRDELVLLNERARRVGYSGLIVIFDSLEKLRGVSSTWKSVLESAERVFDSDAPYLQLPVHVLYTIPPALVFRLKMDPQYLPMIKLRARDGTTFKPGFEAAREIIRKRIPDEILREMLGPTSAEERVKALITWSGGYPREIVRLLQAVLEIEESSVTTAEFQRILSRTGNAYRNLVLGGGGIELLARVAVDHNALLNTEEEREMFGRLVSNNVVLRYQNQEDWFDVHPAVSEIREVQDAIERLRTEREKGGA